MTLAFSSIIALGVASKIIYMIYDRAAYAGDPASIRSTFLQIIDAADRCHTNYVHHGDLKPFNFLCNEDGPNVFLTDFGLATRDDASCEHGHGTVAIARSTAVQRK